MIAWYMKPEEAMLWSTVAMAGTGPLSTPQSKHSSSWTLTYRPFSVFMVVGYNRYLAGLKGGYLTGLKGGYLAGLKGGYSAGIWRD